MLARTPDPWVEGTYLLPGSADGQPCIYGDEREVPLVVFDADDPEAAGNCRLMSLAGVLLEKLGELADVLWTYSQDCDDDQSEKLVIEARNLIARAQGKRYRRP
jgi:hypothetical protein